MIKRCTSCEANSDDGFCLEEQSKCIKKPCRNILVGMSSFHIYIFLRSKRKSRESRYSLYEKTSQIFRYVLTICTSRAHDRRSDCSCHEISWMGSDYCLALSTILVLFFLEILQRSRANRHPHNDHHLFHSHCHWNSELLVYLNFWSCSWFVCL